MKRWAVGFISYGILTVLVLLTGLLNLDTVDRTQLFVWAGMLALVALSWRFVPRSWLHWPLLPYLKVIGTAGAAGWLIHFSGRWNSPYFGLYLLTPFAAVIHGPSWPAALLTGALNTLSLILAGGWPPPQSNVATTQIAVLWMAGVAGALTAIEGAEQQRALRVSQRIALAASMAFDLDRLLKDLLQALSGAARVSSAYVLMVERENDHTGLVCRGAVGPAADTDIPRIPLGQGVTGRAAETGQVIYVSDVRRDPDYIAALTDTRSELALPLKLGERVIGVVNLESHRPRAFGRRDRRLLQVVMPPITLAVNNALLAKQMTRVSLVLSASAVEVAASAEAVSDRLKEVAQSMEEMARGGQIQAAQAEETHQAVKRLTQDTDRIAARAEETATAAQQVTAVVKESMTMLHAVGEQAGEVAQMVKLVEKLAHQTHLLALNAAIEAARAGEYGQSFAVVADEIRRLAERSRHSATEIAEQNQKMEEALSKLAETARQVGDMVERTETLAADISQATQHQRQRMSSINRAVDEVAAAAEQGAAITQQVNTATETQTAAMSEVRNSATKLAGLANQLDHLVSQTRQKAPSDILGQE